jgi:hypothetical protein
VHAAVHAARQRLRIDLCRRLQLALALLSLWLVGLATALLAGRLRADGLG